MTVGGIPVGRGVEPGPRGGPELRVAGFSLEPLDPGRLRRHLGVYGPDTEPLLLKVRDDGADGNGVSVTVSYGETQAADNPLVWLSLTPEQARLVHAALGCVLHLRAAQAAATAEAADPSPDATVRVAT
jgi:hypothetical protein